MVETLGAGMPEALLVDSFQHLDPDVLCPIPGHNSRRSPDVLSRSRHGLRRHGVVCAQRARLVSRLPARGSGGMSTGADD